MENKRNHTDSHVLKVHTRDKLLYFYEESYQQSMRLLPLIRSRPEQKIAVVMANISKYFQNIEIDQSQFNATLIKGKKKRVTQAKEIYKQYIQSCTNEFFLNLLYLTSLEARRKK